MEINSVLPVFEVVLPVVVEVNILLSLSQLEDDRECAANSNHYEITEKAGWNLAHCTAIELLIEEEFIWEAAPVLRDALHT